MSSLMVLPLLRTEVPDTILYNGNIWTLDEAQPRAQAVAINGARFVAVGSNTDILPLASARTRKIDLGFKSVLPGFNDAHAHPVESGVEHLRKVACDKDSIEIIEAALHQRALQTPPGQWVLGFLYDDGKTPRPLNRHDLDQAVPDRPVLVQHRGGHTAFVNSLALQLAKVNDQTPDPSGGRFEHDAEGHLTGFVGDAAASIFLKLISDQNTRLDSRQGAALISKLFTSKGVTGFGDEWVRIGGVKQYADGSISERTAWLSQPLHRDTK